MREVLAARIKAFFEEFPFLKRYVKIHRFDTRPMVQRIDLDLLDQTPITREAMHGPGRAWGDETRFFLIGPSGEELGEVRRTELVGTGRMLFGFIPWWSSPEVVDGETVYEALVRIHHDSVRFVVEIVDRWERRADFDPEYGLSLILHKAPAGYTLSEWLPRLQELAREELAGELNEIDASA